MEMNNKWLRTGFLILTPVIILLFTSCLQLPTSTSSTGNPSTATTGSPSKEITIATKYPSAKLMAPEIIDSGLPSATSVLITPMAIVGQAYLLQLPAFGGRPPYRWELVSGSLPPGMNLDPTGKVSGTPLKSDHYKFNLILSDSEGTEVSQNVRITAAQILPTPTNQGEMGPRDVYSTPIAPLVYYTTPLVNAIVSVIIPADYSCGQYFAMRPCVQGAGDSWTFRLVGLPKNLTYDTNSGLIQGEITGLTAATQVDTFLHGANGKEAQASFTLKPPASTYIPTTTSSSGGGGGGATSTTINTANQYIDVYISQSTYGIADIWVDGAGPYRQQYRAPASVGTHTIRIKTYGSTTYPAFDKTVSGSVSPGKYWSYQLK
jgi:hypothetical protein